MTPKNPNAYSHTVNNDPRNKTEVVIGDDKATPFAPQTKITRFGNDANLSMRLKEMPFDNRNLIKQQGDMILYGDEKKKMRSYPKENAWEFDWILFERPLKDYDELTLQIKNLEFYYQPPLDEEITPADGETVTATHHYDKDGNVLSHRPEEMVGSYAVYMTGGKHWNRQSPNMAMWYKLLEEYKNRDNGGKPTASFAHLDTLSKLNNEIMKYELLSTPELPFNKTYMTGKFCHIPRPKLIDANGNEAYADLHMDRETALMKITYPKTFLDNAQYPVTVDPTFGYTSMGGTDYSFRNSGNSHNRLFLQNLSENGTLDSITAAFHNNQTSSYSVTAQLALYDKDGSGTDSHTLVASNTDTISTPDVPDWRTINFSSENLTSGDKIFYISGTGGVSIFYYTRGDSVSNYSDSNFSITYTDPPADPLNESDTSDFNLSIYATYTAVSSGDFIPRNASVI